MNKLRILVVDDNEHNQNSARMLEQAGHEVTIENCLTFAVGELDGAKYNGKPYDVLLTDMNFPTLPALSKWCEPESTRDPPMTTPEPLGYALALYAVKLGVPKIAVLTSEAGHPGQMTKTLNLFSEASEYEYLKGKPEPLMLGSSKIVFYLGGMDIPDVWAKKDGRFSDDIPHYGSADEQSLYIQEDVDDQKIFVRAKNWVSTLDDLMS